MRSIFDITGEIIREAVSNIGYFFAFNMRYITSLMSIGVPYVMYLLGQNLALGRGYFAVGGEVFLPLVMALIINYMRQVANKMNKGTRIPIPTERFTEVGEDGEVTIPESRLPELLLYTADLEDWMERKGWL